MRCYYDQLSFFDPVSADFGVPLFRISRRIYKYFPGLKGPCKFGVATVDSSGRVLNMIEKPQVPESEWAVPPFYIYKRSDLNLFAKGIASGCKTDAPGSFIEWLCKQTTVHAFEMPGQRFDPT